MSEIRAVFISREDRDHLFKIALSLEDWGGLLGNPHPGFIRSIAYQYDDYAMSTSSEPEPLP